MKIDILGTDLYTWWKEYCPLCGTANHIFFDNSNADAFQCWNCLCNFWLDDMAQTSYMIVHNKTVEESDNDLRWSRTPIIILNGQMGRDSR